MATQTQSLSPSDAVGMFLEAILRRHRIRALVDQLSAMRYSNSEYRKLDSELRELLAEEYQSKAVR